jgi:hypothetical protein
MDGYGVSMPLLDEQCGLSAIAGVACYNPDSADACGSLARGAQEPPDFVIHY